jgi:Tfp pilus assembly protein PilF
MERAAGRPSTSRILLSWKWHLTWQILPAAAIALGAFLLARGLAERGHETPPSAMVDSQYEARLAANIDFFSTRVDETHDSLSYNRLVSLYLERLRLHGDVSDVRRAEIAAEKGLDAAPNAYANILAMAQVRLAQHDFEAVLSLVAKADTLKAAVPDSLAIRGDAEMALGRYREAGDDYRAYLDAAPEFSAFSREATYAEVNGNFDVAVQFWKAAIDSAREESPVDAAWARVQLGNLYATNGKVGAASDEYRTALDVFPGYALAEAGLARVAVMRGDYGKAADGYRAVTAKLPSAEFVAAYADVAARAGRTAEATRQGELLAAIGQLYEANGIRNDLTLILFDLDHGKASAQTVAAARKAYEERPSLAAADVYGWALYRDGQVDAARKLADEAIGLGTREPLYLFHAGMIAKAQGDSAGSREFLQRALEINPSFHPVFASDAKQALKELGGAK